MRREDSRYVNGLYEKYFPSIYISRQSPKRWRDQIRGDIVLLLVNAEQTAKNVPQCKACVTKNCAKILIELGD